MFRFIAPLADNQLFHVALGGRDLYAAFDEFRRHWWQSHIPSAIAVYHNHALVARVLPTLNLETLEMEPRLEML